MTTNKVHDAKCSTVIVKGEIDGFVQVTPVKTFQFVKHSAHWTESIFWIVLLVGGTSLAVRDVHKACQEFANEETYTSMGVTGLQRLTFDDAIVCVEYDPRTLNLTDPRLLMPANTSTMVIELAAKANTSAIELLSTSLKLFTVITLIENGRTADYEEKVAELLEDENVEKLQTWLLEQRVSILELQAAVRDWLCHAAHIRIATLKRGRLESSVNPCEEERITWLGVIPFVDISTSEMAVCVDLGGKISFESMDRIVVSVNTNGLFPQPETSTNRTSSKYLLNAFLDFSGEPVFTDLTKELLQFPVNDCSAFGIKIDAEMRLLSRRVARCDETAKTRLACFARCDVLRYALEERCACIQLAWSYLYPANRTLCVDVHTIRGQLDCRHAVSRTNFSQECFHSCRFPCAQAEVGITRLEGCDEGRYEEGGAAIELSPKRFTRPVFEEHFSPTVSELFSRIGGTCGLWLGVGLIGICHALLFPIKLMMKLTQQSCSRQGSIPASMELSQH